MRPLVHVVDEAGLARGCPLLEIDRLRGDSAGGRFVLAPSDAPLTAGVVRAAVLRALEGSAELFAVPIRATVEEGELASVRVTRRRALVRSGEAAPGRAQVAVRDAAGHEVFAGEVELVGPDEARTGVVTIRPKRPLTAGLYHAQVSVPDAPTHPKTVTTGFWVRDARLLGAGPRVTASRDWLRKDGKVFPVVGTTYMASDVHRKFLFEPNPHVWDARLRGDETARRQLRAHRPVDGLVAGSCSTRARSTRACCWRSTPTCSARRATASSSASTSSRSFPRLSAATTRTSTRARSKASARC